MSSLKTWMTDRYDLLKDQSIYQIILPGTHNAGVFSPDNTIGVRNQNIDIHGQLHGGIRFFDVRVTKWKNNYYMHHNNICANSQLFATALQQFRTFAKEYPKEKFIIRLDTGWGSNITDGEKNALRQYVLRELEDCIAPRPIDENFSLGNLKGSIIVLSAIGQEKGAFWLAHTNYTNSWQGWQSDFWVSLGAKKNRLHGHLLSQILEWSKLPNLFRDASCCVWTINLWDAANNINPLVSDWVRGWSQGQDKTRFLAGANIFSVDFFAVSNIVEQLVVLNEAKFSNQARTSQRSKPVSAKQSASSSSASAEQVFDTTPHSSMPVAENSESFSLEQIYSLLGSLGYEPKETFTQIIADTNDSSELAESLDKAGLPVPVLNEIRKWHATYNDNLAKA